MFLRTLFAFAFLNSYIITTTCFSLRSSEEVFVYKTLRKHQQPAENDPHRLKKEKTVKQRLMNTLEGFENFLGGGTTPYWPSII